MAAQEACSSDSSCIAVSYRSSTLGTSALYTSANCASGCSNTAWQENRELIVGTSGVAGYTCWVRKQAPTCPPEFATAKILYCNGTCKGTDGVNGCQQADADDYCKLHNCCTTSVATSWDNLVATNVPGFSCGEHDYGENKGDWFGIPNIHTEADVLSTHGPGASITNAVCTPC
eukprot:scaffold90303_cov68-Phaeocystis_antarctica.AAC.1